MDTIHFYSDGPTSQYRQKLNFFMFSKIPAERGYRLGTWNFHESGHGKGAPDGVGAAIKRSADMAVASGKDITSASAMYNALKESQTSIDLYLISVNEIQSAVAKLEGAALKPVPGTMRIHQVLTQCHGKISHRVLSCLCNKGICNCYGKRDFIFDSQDVAGEAKDDLRKESRDPDKTQKSASNVPHEKRQGVKRKANHSSGSPKKKTKNKQAHTGEGFFEALLTDLQQAKSFDELRAKCITYKQEIGDLNCRSPPKPVKLLPDEQSLCLVPEDILSGRSLTPAEVTADGDCLPRSGSVLAFGEDDHPMEITRPYCY